AGIGPQETVVGRIQSAGQSVADALGGGASANADGTVSAGIGPQETVVGRIQSAGQSVADALGGGASANAD
ncbi:hypothetical protein C7E17_27090, partial [Stenotrophomonas maltophilia]